MALRRPTINAAPHSTTNVTQDRPAFSAAIGAKVRLNISGSARRETAPSLPRQEARRGPPPPCLGSGTRGGPSIYGDASSRIWSSITFQSGITAHQSNLSMQMPRLAFAERRKHTTKLFDFLM